MTKRAAKRPLPTMSDRERLNEALIFEPHNMAGRKFQGEEMPFGYISTWRTPMPVFELRTILGWDATELRALAKRLASVNDLLAASIGLMAMIDPDGESTDIWCVAMREAIARAGGQPCL